MPVSRGRDSRRRSHKSRRRSGNPAHGDDRLSAELLRSMTDPEMSSALMAEAEVSRFLGVAWWLDALEQTHKLQLLSEELLDRAARGTRPGARELLAVLSSVGPADIAEMAAAELGRREEPEPGTVAPWYDDVGRWTPTRTLRISDVDGDAEQWVVVFAGPDGGEDHAVVWFIDVWDGGSCSDVILVDRVDEALAKLQAAVDADSQAVIDHPEPAVLRAVAERAMRITDMTVPDEDDDEWPYATFRALAHGRLRLLPPPAELPEPLDQEAREALVDDFVASPYALELAEPQADEAGAPEDSIRYVARLLVDYAVDYSGSDPLRISPLTVEVFLLHWVQRKAILDADSERWLPDIVGAWARYAFAAAARPTERLAATLAAVDEHGAEFRRLAATGERRGVAAQLIAGLVEEGVDVSDPEQLAAALKTRGLG